MRYAYISILVMLFCCGNNKTTIDDKDCSKYYDKEMNRNIYSVVDEVPTYPGGNQKLFRHVQENIKMNNLEEGEVKILLTFVILETGQMIKCEISGKEKKEYTALESEIIRVISSAGKWNPGKCSGVVVPVNFTFPLSFHFS